MKVYGQFPGGINFFMLREYTSECMAVDVRDSLDHPAQKWTVSVDGEGDGDTLFTVHVLDAMGSWHKFVQRKKDMFVLRDSLDRADIEVFHMLNS